MLYFLQLARFAASLLVLFFHLKLSESGYKGVDIFFVISGFVMYYTLFSVNRPSGVKFIINRFTKIFFLYWVAIVILYFILPRRSEFFNLRTLLLFPGHVPLLGVSWSLSYELYFYLILGLVVYRVPAKFYKYIFFVMLIITTSVTLINLTRFTFKGSMINFLAGQNPWEFLLGLLSGYCFNLKTFRKFFSLNIALLSFLLLIIISIPWNTPISYIIYGPLSFLFVWFMTAYEKLSPMNRFKNLIKILGEASYGIYLFGPIITVIVVPRNTALIVTIIIVTILFSILFNRFIESKVLKWSRLKISGFMATAVKSNKAIVNKQLK